MTRRLNWWLLSLLLIIGAPYYWFVVDPTPGVGFVEPNGKPITIEQLRTLAQSIKGHTPYEVRVETLKKQEVPGNALIAGTGIRKTTTASNGYQLRTTDNRSILILPGVSHLISNDHNVLIMDNTANANIQRVKSKASLTILLSQTGKTTTGETSDPTPQEPYAIAPGVVIIPTSGLDANINMVYVRQIDNREFLFTGDIAPLDENWREMKVPARLALRNKPAGWRKELHEWVGTINALSHAAPEMVIVSGYDTKEIPFTAGRFSD